MIERLQRDGFLWTIGLPHTAEALRLKLDNSPAFTAHVIPQGDRTARTLADALAQPHGFACHRMADVLATPGLFAAVSRPHRLAAEYFGQEPALYSVNAFWKKPNGAPGWHHDSDDGPHQLVMFMYGTDVPTDDDGVHAYVTGSHVWDREKLRPFHNVQEDVSGPLPAEWPVHRFHGLAGTTFLTDTRGLHNGFAPITAPRLLLWARWCAGDPPAAYVNDEVRPVPWRDVVSLKPSPEIQSRTRLVVDWES